MPDWDKLRAWFLEKKRSLPWRDEKNPYKVWVSEIMLQQTQVTVVLPYFKRWMQEFPYLEDLAQSPIEKVIKCWEGLGYYSRARNLQKGAQFVLEQFSGELPSNREALLKIPGIGPYTAGAILAFGFQQKAAAIDGNVQRVLARYFKVEEEISRVKTQENLRQKLETLLPANEPWTLTEALIELGALVCKKQPLCHLCPIKEGCVAFKENLTDKLPIKKPPAKITQLQRVVALVQYEQAYLVRKVPEGEVMEGLYEFPFLETETLPIEEADFIVEMKRKFKLFVQPIRRFPALKHGFTRYTVKLETISCIAKKRKGVDGYSWIAKDQLSSLPFSSGHRQVLHKLLAS